MAVSWSHGDVNNMKIPVETLFGEKLVKFSLEQNLKNKTVSEFFFYNKRIGFKIWKFFKMFFIVYSSEGFSLLLTGFGFGLVEHHRYINKQIGLNFCTILWVYFFHYFSLALCNFVLMVFLYFGCQNTNCGECGCHLIVTLIDLYCLLFLFACFFYSEVKN